MQKQKKTTLTESQVKLKKYLKPIVEGILNETPISTNSVNYKILYKMLTTLGEMERTTSNGQSGDQLFDDIVKDIKNLKLKTYNYMKAHNDSLKR
jgi:hypothetical protein